MKTGLIWGMDKVLIDGRKDSKYVASTKAYYNCGTTKSKTLKVKFECDRDGKISTSFSSPKSDNFERIYDFNREGEWKKDKETVGKTVMFNVTTALNVTIYELIKACESVNEGCAFISNIGDEALDKFIDDNYSSYIKGCERFVMNKK